MNELIIFNFKGNKVREITDRNNNPWFVAKDICRVLGISNHKDAISTLDKDEKYGVGIPDSMGREQETTIINESGLYSLILRSRKPEAKAFKKWVTAEVLPSIRKNGGYLSPSIDFSDPENIQRILDSWKKDRERLRIAQPKADRLDKIANSKGLLLPRAVGKILTGHPNNFLKWAVRNRILYRLDGKLIPYSEYQERGYFEVKEAYNEIQDKTYFQTYFTPKGVDWITEKYEAIEEVTA